MTTVLFLDDMQTRHDTFFSEAMRSFDGLQIYRAYSAAEAISLLNERNFDQVFLDHDLSEDDIMVAPGASSKVPTGQTVVDHIMTMQDPPRQVFVHSCNGPAAERMALTLREHPVGIKIIVMPFPHLIAGMKAHR